MFGRSATHDAPVEHGSSRLGRALRARRLRTAGIIALVEALLVVVHAIPRLPALIVAGAIVGVYLWAGRHIRSDAARQLGWIVAVSQALVLLVPIFAFFFWTLAIVALAVLGVIALMALLSERA
ncbi:MAG: hypothetical protein WBB74_12575 [Gaiellaceae bacterium]